MSLCCRGQLVHETMFQFSARTVWEQSVCPLFGGCPLAGGSAISKTRSVIYMHGRVLESKFPAFVPVFVPVSVPVRLFPVGEVDHASKIWGVVVTAQNYCCIRSSFLSRHVHVPE